MIRFFKDFKIPIFKKVTHLQGIIDYISVTNINDDTYLLCADYSRFDNNDKLLFEGRTHYVYIGFT